MRLIKANKSCYQLFYEFLKQREPYQNISHEEMPSYEAHCLFNDRKPYKYDWVIENNGQLIGRIYITYNDEIGIYLVDKERGRGFGGRVMEEVKKSVGRPLYANISPRNKGSQKFFEYHGFKLIQYTYKW